MTRRETRQFPDGFDWGTATAAHQIEGGNVNNDWWAFEHTPGPDGAPRTEDPSGDACDSWNRWADDVDLVARGGLTSYRFSIEWSRIEPEPGEWSHAAIDHYRRQCAALLARGIDPVVTFHHFSSPRWIAARGGWTDPATADAFAAFCARAAAELGPFVRRACTINEPNIVALMGHLLGVFPPGHADLDEFTRVTAVFNDAHRKAVAAIRANAPGVPVGLTLSMTDYQALPGGEAARDEMRAMAEDEFFACVAPDDDFFGVQTYSRFRVDANGLVGPEDGVPVLPMGYEYYPASLGNTIRRAWEVTGGKVPLYVTENGIGTDDDTQRTAYVDAALDGVLDCLDEGIDVRGYTYWSLLDNFEWAFGYRPHFGLVAVDRATFARTPKPSFEHYADIVRAGSH